MNKKYDMGLTPPAIVKELDQYIVGQNDAKKAVAIAMRNRYRRKQVDNNLKSEIIPKNILMVGPTGVGKTEIARRLAKIGDAPFIKVEATKFTEVGYVGRDVESIIRDLTMISLNLLKDKYKKLFEPQAKEKALDRTIDGLVGDKASDETKETFRNQILAGELDDKEIEIEIDDISSKSGMNLDIPNMMQGISLGIINLSDMFGKALEKNKSKKKTLRVKDAYKALLHNEIYNLMDEDQIIAEALDLVENEGVVFIDEIDKISSHNESSRNGNVSREGVQRDLLPLLEGTIVNTKYGSVNTDHILFIASGAFHLSNPSDMLPELQGRLPIRVELKQLDKKDMVRILSEPQSSLIKQYEALIGTEGVLLKFTKSAIDKIADYAMRCNDEIEDIGARRLHTILEKLLEDISFNAGSSKTSFTIDAKYTDQILRDLIHKSDYTKFIL